MDGALSVSEWPTLSNRKAHEIAWAKNRWGRGSRSGPRTSQPEDRPIHHVTFGLRVQTRFIEPR
jgi:hypothetical protein